MVLEYIFMVVLLVGLVESRWIGFLLDALSERSRHNVHWSMGLAVCSAHIGVCGMSLGIL